MDRLALYRQMARARAFELVLADLWDGGAISGEMHLGTGEEAVAAGICAHLRRGDAVALDHRPTPVLTILGVDLVAMLREMLGEEDGLCRGRGGHMHLMSPGHLAASSGIVGSSGPMGVGFALAAKLLRRGSVGVSFFGDGAANQGMMLEAWNLAKVWELPMLFVCKDNGWAITTQREAVTAGDLGERARSFGLEVRDVDGLDVEAVASAAHGLIERARRGRGPSLLVARCSRLDGHMLGDPMLRLAASPLGEGKQLLGRVMSAAFTSGGGGVLERAASMGSMVGALQRVRKQHRDGRNDPMVVTRRALRSQAAAVEAIDREVGHEMAAAKERALLGRSG